MQPATAQQSLAPVVLAILGVCTVKDRGTTHGRADVEHRPCDILQWPGPDRRDDGLPRSPRHRCDKQPAPSFKLQENFPIIFYSFANEFLNQPHTGGSLIYSCLMVLLKFRAQLPMEVNARTPTGFSSPVLFGEAGGKVLPGAVGHAVLSCKQQAVSVAHTRVD